MAFGIDNGAGAGDDSRPVGGRLRAARECGRYTMSYYARLGLEREPFSTSPDPSFLYMARGHRAALCRLQIAISLRRGLCVVMGDVGTGKTTLSRKLATLLMDDPQVQFHMILNPYFKSEEQFLARLASLFHVDTSRASDSGLDYMDAIERHLFRCAVEQDLTVVLLIDEAQILPDFVLETLRILLNYETNEYKMLQLVLMGQMELLPRISRMENFWDRIAMKYILKPLDVDEVRELLAFRLARAGYAEPAPLFTEGAIRRIWSHTRGYPRKLAALCHQSLESLVMFDRALVDEGVVDAVIAADVMPVSGPSVAPLPT